MASKDRVQWVHCPTHDKRGYRSRSDARRAIRGLHDPRPMREYRCTQGLGFHIGHLPLSVLKGRTTAKRYFYGSGGAS